MLNRVYNQNASLANQKQGILDLPNFIKLKATLDAYYEDDLDTLTSMVTARYKATVGKLMTIPLRFFRTFINEQASLYSNHFIRTAGGEFNQDDLNNAMMDVERYFFMFKKAAISYSITASSGIDELGTTEQQIQYKALDPTVYFRDTRTGYYWYQEAINSIVMYRTEKEKVMKYKYVGDKVDQATPIEFRTMDLASVLHNFNYNEDLSEQYYVFEQQLDYLPILEISQPRVRIATGNGLVKLQENYIASMSWGLFNADPKLLSQPVIKTSLANEEAKKNFANLGLTTEVMKIQIMDEVKFIDTGNIDVLDNLITIYGKLLEQQALQNGVDKNSIINNNKMVSGESKKVELNYINKYRRNFFIQFMAFEKRLFEHINEWTDGITYEGIQFLDIDLAPDPMEQVLLAAEMESRKFMTFAEAFSYVRNVTVEEAEVIIKERGIELDKSGNLKPEEPLEAKGANYESKEQQQPDPDPQPRNPDTRPRRGK